MITAEVNGEGATAAAVAASIHSPHKGIPVREPWRRSPAVERAVQGSDLRARSSS